MKLTNLEESPQFVEKTVTLIERAFGYTSENSFEVDFYPLVAISNHKNCHILIDKETVVAHIGQLSRDLKVKGNTYTISMYGGIAVNEEYQGQGVFKKFFKKILSKYSKSTLHLLWSEKVDLYTKFSFYPAIEMYEYEQMYFQHPLQVVETKLHKLEEQELESIKELYNKSNEVRFTRSNEHWSQLKEITSSLLFLIKEGDEIINYFIKNKGADLNNIIHEYGHIELDHLQVMQNYGIVWSSKKLANNRPKELLASIVKIGNEMEFKKFTKDVFKIEINKQNSDQIEFQFNNVTYQHSVNDFLLGIFGPGKYEELNASPVLYICGLDSI